jgi:hypothetical protein
VLRGYNGLGQLTGEYQSHSGAVNTTTTPKVQYAYTEMSNGENNSRPVSLTYPNGYLLNYNYNSGLDDRISHLSSLSDGTGVVESYLYLGLDTVVERDHMQNNFKLSYLTQPGEQNVNTDGWRPVHGFGSLWPDRRSVLGRAIFGRELACFFLACTQCGRVEKPYEGDK